MNNYKEGDVVVVNCTCCSKECKLKNWIGTIIKKEYYGTEIEFTEKWWYDKNIAYDEEFIKIKRLATEQEKFMYLVHGSRALEKE